MAAQYLAAHPQAPKVAFAGRNEAKIRNVIAKLTNVSKERVDSIGVLVASAEDEASLQHMAQSANVLINMVGPYALYKGFEVAKACAEAGTGYVDLTGESSVYKHIVKDLHSVSKQTKAILVPSSGFDSLPFDLSTYMAVKAVREATGQTADIDYALCGYLIKGSVSGGTIASLAEQAKEHDIGFRDPYDLSPKRGTQVAKAVKVRALPQFAHKYGSYTLFTPHNTGVANRTWGLLEEAQQGDRYGPKFRYLEGYVTHSAVGAYLVSSVMLLITWLLTHTTNVGSWMRKAVPQGTGAPMEKQLKGFANIRTVAFANDGKTKGLATFKVKGDPGYLKTAAFISETALTIAFEKQRLQPVARQGGVLTPAAMGGEVLAERLSKYAGVTIETKDVSNSLNMAEEIK
ncbi:glycolipid biosynthetic protein [Malassezia pachydermatis]